jgi:hypothetical protein
VLGSILFEVISGEGRDYALLISPLSVLEGSVHWIFNSAPHPESEIAQTELNRIYYFLAALGYSVVSLAIVYRRFARLAV